MKKNLKIQLHQKCLQLAEKRVVELKNILQDAQDAANNETKSSAGDKHETGRAMAQLETEKLTGQLTDALKVQQVLVQISPQTAYKQVALGSLVTTNNAIFYIAVGMGKVIIENETIFVISTISPIGKILFAKKEKESFSFNGITYVINSII